MNHEVWMLCRMMDHDSAWGLLISYRLRVARLRGQVAALTAQRMQTLPDKEER